MPRERRRAPRFAIQHLIELSFGRETFVRATGVNISSSGLLCNTDPPIEPYTRVFLSLKLPTEGREEIVNCEGIVVRSEPASAGANTAIVFTGFEPDEAEKLVKLLGGHERDPRRVSPRRKNRPH